MSNFDKKQTQELAIAFARELAELTGETPSRLYQWGKNLGLPLPKSRQTFYAHIARNNWKMASPASSTDSCRMNSRPLSCELRLRVVSLKTQFRRDKKESSTRQLIILLGYEVCSGLLHFRIYRGTDFEGEADDIPLCNLIPPATVAVFVEECGRMIGLPIQTVLLTQKIMDFEPSPNEEIYLSLATKTVTHRGRKEEAGENELRCIFGKHNHPYQTLDCEHPFVTWCEGTNATNLAAYLSNLVKHHNKVVALPCLKCARRALERLMRKSYDHAQMQHGSSPFPMTMPPFLQRMMKHDYMLNEFALHDVRFYKRPYEDFFEFPGDQGRLARKSVLGDTAT